MKGDFSSWQFDPHENFTGVLQQQGRVLLDRDWNEQTRITTHWQDVAGRDVIGAGVAAVPVTEPDGFKVTQALVAGTAPNQQVELQVTPGRAWIDGLLCHLAPAVPGSIAPVLRVADYLQPPLDPTPGSLDTIAPGVRDAVILEVCREELSAFQIPARLLEPALGGPDTTERSHLRLAFKLFRLAPGETCLSIRDALRHDPSTKGRLTVRLQPTVVVPGDCPVVAGGGYSGFEHFLYRVEVAAVNAAQPRAFKWSQFNGGLVGRGQLLAGPNRISLTANQAAILNSGLSGFYCEVLAYDAGRGVWNPVFGADVTLNGGELTVGTVRLGAFSAATSTVFFRLWNGIRPIADFTNSASPQELIDGIQLVFDPATATNYAPGDFWTFPVRAGEIENADVLIDDRPPFGPVYHRASLAEINWGSARFPVWPPALEDCRRRFRPLTRLDTCCTVRVGDGLSSLGDYTRIQEAIESLPPEGGEVCILPGLYVENITLTNRDNITLSGCGPRTVIRSAAPTGEFGTAAPVIHVRGGSNLAFETFAVEAHPTGAGIVLEAEKLMLDHVTLHGLVVTGGTRAAVRAKHVAGFRLVDSLLRNLPDATEEHTVVILGDDVHVEHNTITVDATAPDPTGAAMLATGPRALGGLHLEGGCERVRVIDNHIHTGSGRGITLGSLRRFDDKGEPVPDDGDRGWWLFDPCEPTRPITGVIIFPQDEPNGEDGSTRIRPAGPIVGLRIERNRIHGMGMDAIGVHGFFDLRGVDAFISVRDVFILGNDLRGNLRRPVEIPKGLEKIVGFGGIALADAENLVIRDNTIAENGASQLDPVCGIFVLHGEGVEIARNHILDNGPRDGTSPANAKPGHRGGIVLVYAIAPTREIALPGNANGATGAAQGGVPAARIHGNVVSAPLGYALCLDAVGPVAVSDNAFTSQGVTRGSSATFLAGAVRIMNLGFSNEYYLQYLSYSQVATPNANSGEVITTSAGRPGLDDRGIGRYLANGNVLFTDNQVTLDLFEAGTSLALSSTLILTLDDLAFHDNQLEANLADDFILVNALLFGLSARVSDNRFKEGIGNALLSALTAGLFMNTTAHNQGTHCILAINGVPSRLIDGPNTTMMAGIEGDADGDPEASPCLKMLQSMLGSLATAGTGAAAPAPVAVVTQPVPN